MLERMPLWADINVSKSSGLLQEMMSCVCAVEGYLGRVPNDELAGAEQLQHALHIHAGLPPLLQVLKALLAKVPVPHH